MLLQESIVIPSQVIFMHWLKSKDIDAQVEATPAHILQTHGLKLKLILVKTKVEKNKEKGEPGTDLGK